MNSCRGRSRRRNCCGHSTPLSAPPPERTWRNRSQNSNARTKEGSTSATGSTARASERAECADLYSAAYRGYCWPVEGVGDLKPAPFHLLATEGAVHTDRDHAWHMTTLAELCTRAPDVLHATAHRVVDLHDEESVAQVVNWWTELTGSGGEGMVVKPLEFLVEVRGKPVQPAVKCRGREYLRIIYGPDYTLPENLSRLRERGLSRKRSLAMREFRLGIEALRRFVAREPLRRVHECAFGVLALESEPVDPRL